MKRTVLLTAIMLGIAYALLEISTAVFYSVTKGQLFSFETIHTAQNRMVRGFLGSGMVAALCRGRIDPDQCGLIDRVVSDIEKRPVRSAR